MIYYSIEFNMWSVNYTMYNFQFDKINKTFYVIVKYLN